MKLKRKFVSLIFNFLLIFGLGVSLLSCKKDHPEPENVTKTYYGKPTPVGDGYIKAWVTTDKGGTPLALGVNISEDAFNIIQGSHDASAYAVSLPKESSSTLYNHIVLNWNPHGHPIQGVYTLPHIDLHFYMIPENERLTIEGLPVIVDTTYIYDTQPAAQYMPADYFLMPGKAAAMGAHLYDTKGPELHGSVFTTTFVYGSNKGTFVFHEPMFTSAYLLDLKQKQNPYDSYPVKQPASYQKAGYYPTSYSYKYDSKSKEYTVAMDNLTFKQ